MARSLAQTISRLAPISPSSLSSAASRFGAFRQRSNATEKLAVAGKAEREESEIEKVALKNLEDAINRIVVKKSEPAWAVFSPGSSYWVAPKTKAHGFAEMVAKLVDNPSTAKTVKMEQVLSRSYNSGWPSSAYYIKGVSFSPLEVDTAHSQTFETEEEEE